MPASTALGLKILRMYQLVIQALKILHGYSSAGYLGTSPYALKQEVERLLHDWSIDYDGIDGPWPPSPFINIMQALRYRIFLDGPVSQSNKVSGKKP